MDLHAEWSLVQKMEMGVSVFSRDEQWVGTDDVDGLHRSDTVLITYEAAIDR